jgi:hypothetical protein
MYEQKYFARPNSSFPLPVPPALLPDDSADRITTELWWTNQDFSRVDIIHHDSPCSYVTWVINKRPVGGRSSETYSHPIDIMITKLSRK